MRAGQSAASPNETPNIWHYRVEIIAFQHVLEARKVLAECGKLKSLRVTNFHSKRSQKTEAEPHYYFAAEHKPSETLVCRYAL